MLSVSLAVRLCLLTVWLCVSMCVEVIIIMSVGLSVYPKGWLTVCQMYTHTRTHTLDPTYQRLKSTSCTRDTVSYNCRVQPLSLMHTFFLISLNLINTACRLFVCLRMSVRTEPSMPMFSLIIHHTHACLLSTHKYMTVSHAQVL